MRCVRIQVCMYMHVFTNDKIFCKGYFTHTCRLNALIDSYTCVCESNDLFWALYVYFVVQHFVESLMHTQDLSLLSKKPGKQGLAQRFLR